MLRNQLFIDFHQDLKKELFNSNLLSSYNIIYDYIKDQSQLNFDFWKSIWIKTVNDQTMILLLINPNFDYLYEIKKLTSFLKDRNINSLYYQFRTNQRKPDKDENIYHHFGKKTIIEVIDKYKFNISPYSFNQSNNNYSNMLYQNIKLLLKNENSEDLFIYGRTASPISILCHSYFKKIFASIPCSIVYKNMLLDLEDNNINNVYPLYQTKKEFNTITDKKKELIFLSPGVQGLPKNIIKDAIRYNKIYLLYCNFKKLERDLIYFKKLKFNLEIKKIDQHLIIINNYNP